MRHPSGSPRPSNTPIPALANQYFFILASGSPRRRELLQLLDLPFTVILPDPSTLAASPIKKGGVDETPLPGELPTDLVQRLSRAKAQAVAALLPSLTLSDSSSEINDIRERTVIIIAADTIVVLEDKILGKPATPAEATEMLKQLREHHCHYVYSGLTLGVVPSPDIPKSSPSRRLMTTLHQSKVWMRPYTNVEIEAYVASGDPLDKAGAYAIQNKDFAPVERLEGCFASVMGLPLGVLETALKEMGVLLPDVGRRCAQYSGQTCCIETSSGR